MSLYEFDIGEKDRCVSRFLGDVRSEIQQAFMAEKATRKLTQQQIATLLEVNRSVINRQLTGVENPTCRRVAELAWALGYEPEFRLRKQEVEDGANDRPKPTPHQPLPATITLITPAVIHSSAYVPQNRGYGVVGV
jgi:transcriptional regulator with XRE-family HTH domain